MSSANAKRKNIRPSANKTHKKAMHYILMLEAENEKLRTDPETALGQLIPQMREAVGQNKRLSVLCASIIEAQGGKVTLPKSALDAFETKVLSIKWELPEGVTDASQATEFIFSYEALTQEEVNARQPQITVAPADGGDPTTVELSEPVADEVFEADVEDAEVVDVIAEESTGVGL
jgi:hypothetical protein